MHATADLAPRWRQQLRRLTPPSPLPVPDVEWRPGRTRLTSITVLTWMVRFSAFLNLVAFAESHPPQFIHLLAAWVPFEVSVGRRILMLLTAIMLFVLSSGLERGKRMAYWLTLGALTFSPLIHLNHDDFWSQMLINLPIIALLWTNHRYFVAQSEGTSVRSALIVCPVLLVALMVFGTMRLHDLRAPYYGTNNSWLTCVRGALELVLVHNADTRHYEATPNALILFSELRIGGTSIALLALLLALRPTLTPRGREPLEAARLEQLLRDHGDDPLHPYALLEDKSYFFDSRYDTVIPYVLSGRCAVALTDPIGPPDSRFRAIGEFADFCRWRDWLPIFHEIGDISVPLYRALGFSIFQIGEDARIDPARFDLRGAAFQNLRTLCNKARKESLRFVWYDARRGRNPQLEGELAVVSVAWLAAKHGHEMTFDMGSFSIDEIRRGCTAVALGRDGRAVAFATWRSFDREKGMVLDIMRCLPTARNVLDFVLVESIRHFRAQGVTDVSLGNAPLANTRETGPVSGMERRAVRFIYENLNSIYAYKPLFEFKRKYRPQWRARYVAYPTGESLPLIGLALVRIHTRQGRMRFLTG